MSRQSRFIGIDCGESHHVMVALGLDGEHDWTRRLENSRRCIESAFRHIVQSVPSGTEVEIVLESLYGFSSLVAETARDLGLVIWQVNSKALHHFRDLEGQPHKDDERDSYLLARIAWLGLKGCRLALAPTPQEQVLRRLSRLHSQITEQRKIAKQRLRSRLLELCPGMVSSSWAGPKWSSASFLAILERWPGLAGLGKARVSTILKVLAAASSVNRQKLAAQAEVLHRLGRSIRQDAETEIIGLETTCLVTTIRTTSQQLGMIDAKLTEQVELDPIAKKLTAMPGLGTFTAAVLCGELRPLARTSRESQVATYAGLTPLNRASGKSQRAVLARGVNKHAQQACYLSALASLQRSALDHAYYTKLHASHQGHPKPHVVAMLALARQRSKVIYKLMTSDAEYDPQILLASHLKRQQDMAASGVFHR